MNLWKILPYKYPRNSQFHCLRMFFYIDKENIKTFLIVYLSNSLIGISQISWDLEGQFLAFPWHLWGILNKKDFKDNIHK